MGQIRSREIQWHGFSVRTGTGRKRKFGVPAESFRQKSCAWEYFSQDHPPIDRSKKIAAEGV